jgi:hypothetical protein
LYKASAGSVVWSLSAPVVIAGTICLSFVLNPAGSTADLQFFGTDKRMEKIRSVVEQML